MKMPSQSRMTCASCALSDSCAPAGLASGEADGLARLISTRLRVRRGAALYRAGDPFKSLYVVWLGSLKSTMTSDDAREQVTGFHLAGETIGFDGFGADSYTCDTVALEDAEVCVIPYRRIEDAGATLPELRRSLHTAISREIGRKQGLMLMLGTMLADERLASFLLDLSDRYALRGLSSRDLGLRMSRAEIGSYLGITLETVSRVLSQFAKDGLIEVRQVRNVRITDRDGLRRLAAGLKTAPACTPPVRESRDEACVPAAA